MNILFFFASEIIKEAGGVENVTSFWWEYFKRQGHNTYIIFWRHHPILNSIIDQVKLPDSSLCSSSINIRFFNNFIETNNVDIVINQSGINNKTSLVCIEGVKKTNAKLISVIHNTPYWFLHSKSYLQFVGKIPFGKQLLKSTLAIIEKSPFYKGGRYQFENSDATVVLSRSYIKEFEQLNIVRKTKVISNIANPLTLQIDKSALSQKDNIVIFVGRLARQKSLDSLLRVWSQLKVANTDNWKLLIIGDGPERDKLVKISNKLKLGNIEFIPFSDPIPYYKKAKIMCLTSSFEGLPMTLIECQAFGTVPIILNTFAAAKDIIQNGQNGILVDSLSQYTTSLEQLMSDNFLIHEMGIKCIEKAHNFSSEAIYKNWENLFISITKKNDFVD